jgi:hypothetical protein
LRRELRRALDDIGLNVTASQLETMFISADLDGNGLIDYSEFKALIYSLQSLDAQWTNERLKRLDPFPLQFFCIAFCTPGRFVT